MGFNSALKGLRLTEFSYVRNCVSINRNVVTTKVIKDYSKYLHTSDAMPARQQWMAAGLQKHDITIETNNKIPFAQSHRRLKRILLKEIAHFVWRDRLMELQLTLFFCVALRPNAGHGLLILVVSRSHTTTHHSQ